MPSTSCSGYPDSCGALQPNPDIAGVGVYVSFIASALLTFIASIILVFSEALVKKEQAKEDPPPLGHVESLPTSMKRKPGRRWEPREFQAPNINLISLRSAELISEFLKPLILGLADQQLITGLALLIAALASWRTISAYHLNIVVYLAWFSSFTHAIALFSLGDFLRRSRILLSIRLVGFVTVFILFIVAQGRTRDFVPDYYGGGIFERDEPDGSDGRGAACPAECSAPNSSYSGSAKQVRICIILMTVFGVFLTWGVIPWLRNLRGPQISGNYSPILHAAGLLSWLAVYAALIYGLGSSIGAAIILRDPEKYPGLEVASNFADQNSWTFGQLVAIILLVLPFLSAIEGFLDARSKLAKDCKEKEGLP